MTTLSLSCSRKIYELLMDTYETEKYWMNRPYGTELGLASLEEAMNLSEHWCKYNINRWTRERLRLIPSPNLAETIRLLPRIAEKKGWRDYVNRSEESGHGMWDTLEDMTCFFVEAPTEEEGMAKVSEYL